MKPRPHPEMAQFVAQVVHEIAQGAPNVLVVGFDKRDLKGLHRIISATMEELRWKPRVETVNLIGWGGTSVRFTVAHDVYRDDLDGSTVFCSPCLVDAGLPEALERALTGVESQLAPL